jgi:hypothetical protein
MNRRHVDQEAAGQCDVAGNARSFFAERLLGNLDDDFLAGLEHFRDELRTAWSGVAAVMTAAGAAAFESLTPAVAAAPIGTPAAIAPEGPLEARARVAPNARGIARRG